MHIFHCKEGDGDDSKKKKSKSTFSRLLGSSTSQKPKSICQIRGIPHPIACAFVGDVPNMLAISGWDADGNGVLLLSEFAAHQEARRVAYHVLVKNSVEETEEERRRRRARGWKPKVPDTPDNDFGNMQITEPSMNLLSTQNTDDDFCEVVFDPPKQPEIEDKPNPDLTTSQTSPDPEGKEQPSSDSPEESPEGGNGKDFEGENLEDTDEFLEAEQ